MQFYKRNKIILKNKSLLWKINDSKVQKNGKKTFKDLTLRNKYHLKGLKMKIKYQNILLHAKLKRIKNKVAISKHNQRIIDNLEESLIPGTSSLFRCQSAF